jgi:hypothetical protein
MLVGLLSKLHDNYGPLIRLWFGPSQLFVSVKDAQLIKEILVKAKDKLPLTERAYRLAFGALNLFVSAFNDKLTYFSSSLTLTYHCSWLVQVCTIQSFLWSLLGSP